jgi:hypothetical protein
MQVSVLIPIFGRSRLFGHEPDHLTAAPNGPEHEDDQRLRWSSAWWSPPPESNRRPHPYHGTTGNRCAERRFPRSRPTVGPKLSVLFRPSYAFTYERAIDWRSSHSAEEMDLRSGNRARHGARQRTRSSFPPPCWMVGDWPTPRRCCLGPDREAFLSGGVKVLHSRSSDA